ncbi:class I SAM-dependent methyltransferase [Castellaniella ginsengisoli]|uniref:Class I SAM-dependent methyltransferase n=1 Tax=Castellaniella ginsengisoli TaxID=546114 RepID=A0AB39CZQ6_9BURK
MLNAHENPSADASIERFDQAYHQKGLASQRMYPNEAMVQFVLGLFGHLAPAERQTVRILEVGCGSGANLWMLSKEGFEVYGLDASAAGLSLAETHLAKKWEVMARLAVGDFTRLPYPDRFFDAVIDVVSLQHLNLKGTSAALVEVARVLKRDGRFFSYRLSDKSCMYLRNALPMIDAATVQDIPSPLPLANNGPTSFIGPALARHLYDAAGLIVESIQTFGRTYVSGDFVEYMAIDSSLRPI